MPRIQAAKKQDKKPQQPPQAPTPAPAARRHVQPVRSRRRDVDAEDHVGQGRARNLRSTGKAREALDPGVVDPVDNPVSKEQLENLAFMEEVITVMVHESTNPQDDPVPTVWNNGISQSFVRGEEQDVKRKYVEVLARAKRTTFTQEELPNKGGYKNVPHTALRYPFSVIRDPNPKGAVWLKSVLRQG